MKKTTSADKRQTVLLADDDEIVLELLGSVLREEGYEVISASDGNSAVRKMNEQVSVALFDLMMPGRTGIECLQYVQSKFPGTETIIITGNSEIPHAVSAMKSGAFDYIQKPADPSVVLQLVKRAIDFKSLKQENRQLKRAISELPSPIKFVGKSPAAQDVIDKIERIAQLDSTVLITGESGVGKGLVARLIHNSGPRHDENMVSVSCAALPRDLVEAELFGHEKGAFTGAHTSRPGRVEVADRGTLFLDEVGDMPLELQPKLLAFLQEKVFERIGGNQTRRVNVRVVAATNQNLKQLCKERRFREDLYFRLNVLPIDIPPLRQRIKDIPLLADYILTRLAKHRGMAKWELDQQVIEVIEAYRWPGNIRELENVLERATAFAESNRLSISDLPEELRDLKQTEPPLTASLAGKSLQEIEKQAIQQTLQACDGNKSKAARVLGISEKSIYNKMKRLNL
jgi:DNA-binding NtrC family response regulator